MEGPLKSYGFWDKDKKVRQNLMFWDKIYYWEVEASRDSKEMKS